MTMTGPKISLSAVYFASDNWVALAVFWHPLQLWESLVSRLSQKGGTSVELMAAKE